MAHGRPPGDPLLHDATVVPHASRSVQLLDVDAGFVEAIPGGDHDLARRVLGVPVVHAAAGAWAVPPRGSWRGPVSALVVATGAICRHVDVGGRTATSFLGPGDVLAPWSSGLDALPSGERWGVHRAATLAVLDARFALAAAKWPQLTVVVVDRMADQVSRAAIHTAIAQLPRVEQRVLAMLWQLADRFGRVGSDGVLVDLPLTHALIGDCVGARRPTVTLALRSLLDEGLLTRRSSGEWVLTSASGPGLEAALAATGSPPLR